MNGIKRMLKEIDIKKLRKTGFFSIFLSTVLSKILVFFGGIIVVKILSKTDYGIYGYILNIIAVLSIMGDFGATSVALQFILEKEGDQEYFSACFRYALKIGFLSSLFSFLLIILSPFFYPYTIEGTSKMTVLLCGVPFLNIMQNFIPTLLRIKVDNKKYSIFQFGVTLITYSFIILLSILFGLRGALVAQYVNGIVIILFGLYLIRHYIKGINLKNVLDSKEKKVFLKLAFATQLNNAIGQLLIIVDTFLVGLLIATPEVIASYKVGSAIPHALSFLPTCVVIYILPYFIKNNKNKNWLRQNFHKLLKYGVLFYGIFSALLIIFSKIIFSILYGNRYYDAVPIFIFLIISFFFSSTIKIPCSNITYSLRKVKFNIVVNISCVVINIISNYIFIKLYGAVGAAITTTIISIISSIAYLIYINILLRKNGDSVNEIVN